MQGGAVVHERLGGDASRLTNLGLDACTTKHSVATRLIDHALRNRDERTPTLALGDERTDLVGLFGEDGLSPRSERRVELLLKRTHDVGRLDGVADAGLGADAPHLLTRQTYAINDCSRTVHHVDGLRTVGRQSKPVLYVSDSTRNNFSRRTSPHVADGIHKTRNDADARERKHHVECASNHGSTRLLRCHTFSHG